jgi:hypothetical protein
MSKADVISRDGTFVGLSSPDVPFPRIAERLIFASEQFWGRAARASNDSRESDARFIFADGHLERTMRPDGLKALDWVSRLKW